MNSFKGNYAIVKAIVVSLDDPEQLGRIQVWIPAYHQDLNKYHRHTGSTSYIGLPWAQVCTPLLGGASTGFLSSLMKNDTVAILPEISDRVWVGFEGGDIRYPVYLGTLKAGEDIDDYNPAMAKGNTLASVILDAYIDSGLTSFGSYQLTNGSYEKFGLLLWSDNDISELLTLINEKNRGVTRSIFGDKYDWFMSNAYAGWNSLALSKEYADLLLRLLSSKEGVSTQKEYALTEITSYLFDAATRGIRGTNNRAYYALLLTRFKADQLVSLYELLGNSYSVNDMYAQLRRQEWTTEEIMIHDTLYETISNYINSGKLQTEEVAPGVSTVIDITPSEYDASARSNVFTLDWVVPYTTNITQVFGRTSFDPNHRGIDVSSWGANGQPVVAPCNGRIAVVQTLESTTLDWSYGNCCDLLLTDETVLPASEISAGVALRYAHLSSLNVTEGQSVVKGEVLGYIGNTGNSYGAHLHLELLKNYHSDKWNGYVDPTFYFKTSFTYS